MLVLVSDKTLGTNYVPPTPSQLVAAVKDANHGLMVSSGLYTNDQVTALRNNAISYFRDLFGIDFSLGFMLADGTIGLSNFVMIPYASQNVTTVNVAFDSTNMNRGAVGDWHGYQYGELVVATANGTFTSGTHAGEPFIAGDILTYFDYNLVKGDIQSFQSREIVTVRSPWIAKSVPNSQGYSDFFAKLEIVDSNGNVGFYDETIVYIKDVSTNIVYTKTRVVATWDNF
jgi:hypothetical protein